MPDAVDTLRTNGGRLESSSSRHVVSTCRVEVDEWLDGPARAFMVGCAAGDEEWWLSIGGFCGGGEKARLEVEAAEEEDEKSDTDDAENRRWEGSIRIARSLSESSASSDEELSVFFGGPWRESHHSLMRSVTSQDGGARVSPQPRRNVHVSARPTTGPLRPNKESHMALPYMYS